MCNIYVCIHTEIRLSRCINIHICMFVQYSTYFGNWASREQLQGCHQRLHAAIFASRAEHDGVL